MKAQHSIGIPTRCEISAIGRISAITVRAALYEAGRGPLTPIPQVMDPAVYNATWVATLWASIVLLAAMLTIRLASRR